MRMIVTSNVPRRGRKRTPSGSRPTYRARRRARLRSFIDDLEDVQTGKLAGRDRRGALGIIEVSRHGNDCVGDRLIEILLGISL